VERPWLLNAARKAEEMGHAAEAVAAVEEKGGRREKGFQATRQL
jgi:hypothetical protein